MILTPIIAEAERISSYRTHAHPSWVEKLFNAHLQGLEQFSGKRVLEIGGVREPYHTLVRYFQKIGAEYATVGLEENKAQYPYVLPVRDFRDIHHEQYDLIISFGVFEKYGIDQSTDGADYRSIYGSNLRDLQKLYSLLSQGGVNLIGTLSDPCLFTESEIQQTGFTLQSRISNFAGLDSINAYKDSELVVMVK